MNRRGRAAPGRLRGPLRTTLTPSGRVVAATAAVALPAGWLFGGALALLGATAGAVLLVAWRSTRARVDAVALSPPAPARAPAGTTARLPLELTHRGGPRVRDLALRLEVPGGLRAAGHVPVLEPGERLHVPLARRFLRRGPEHELVVVAASSHPLGLVESRARVVLPADLLGLPRIGRFAARRFRRGGRAQRLLRARVLGRTQAVEPEGVRPHRPGEPPRRVHWRASARREDLVLRAFGTEAAPPLGLVLSCRPRPRGPFVDVRASFELAVALTATLCDDELRAGRSVGLRIVGDARGEDAGARLAVRRRGGRAGLAAHLVTLAHVQGRPLGADTEVHVEALRRAVAETRRRGEEPLVVLAGGDASTEEQARLETALDAAVLDADDPEVVRCLRGVHARTARTAVPAEAALA